MGRASVGHRGTMGCLLFLSALLRLEHLSHTLSWPKAMELAGIIRITVLSTSTAYSGLWSFMGKPFPDPSKRVFAKSDYSPSNVHYDVDLGPIMLVSFNPS